MARVGSRINGGWYTVDVVSEEVADGQLIVTLDERTISVNRRDPRYWLAFFRVVLSPRFWLDEIRGR